MGAVPRVPIAVVLVALSAAVATAPPATATRCQTPCVASSASAQGLQARPPVGEGQPGRRTLGGTWRFRMQGARRWRNVTLPNDWNAREKRTNRSGVGFYRRDFTLPRTARGTAWIVRFEGAGHAATVSLNGRRIAHHEGSYVPFEAQLKGLRRGVNRLEVRISSKRTASDLTHWRPARFNGRGNGMWWNFAGIHREVSLRPVRGLDVQSAQALPRMACPTCSAEVTVLTRVHNTGARATTARLTASAAGQRIALGPTPIPAGATREIAGTFTIARPRLWDIGRGNLYGLDVSATGDGGAHGSYRTTFGVRDLRKTADGQVFLNGRRLRTNGVSLHEDSPVVGSAWRAPQRADLLRRIKDLGATVVRSHYPLHPATMEALDRRGVLVWEQATVNQVQNDQLAKPRVRAAAVRAVEEMVLRDRGRPSVLAFSVANELAVPVSQGQIDFVRAAAARVRALDPNRLVAIDRVARFGAPDDGHPVWGAVDAIGTNEYFGWYRGAFAPRPPATTADLGEYLATLHAKQPHAALFLTEFGAEANRHGPAGRKGTYAFQTQYLRAQMQAAAASPVVSGAIVWNLRDFRVYPGWDGGNPRPSPPYNAKGLISTNGREKPAYSEVRRMLQAP